jgi:phosphohistidine phosphatase
MRLYLMRHGIAIDREDPKCPPEPERMLTKKGRERTKEAAHGIAALGVSPGAMYSSPYTRAHETARIVADALEFSVKEIRKTTALLPNADPADMLKLLAKEDAAEVWCFGHAPHLDEMIARILGTRQAVTALGKAGVACLELGLSKAQRGWLVWLAEPRMLRNL